MNGKTFVKLLALLCVFVMLLTVTTACGKSKNESDEYSVIWEEVSGDKTSIGESNAPGGQDTSDGQGGSQGGSHGNTSGGQANTSGGKNNTSGSGTSTSVDASKYRGTVVKYATWKDPKLNEDGSVVEAFQKRYGITVQVVSVPQGGYIQKIMGYIASGDAPDVYIDTAEWPATLGIAAPITDAQIDMSDPIWDQATFKTTTINGKVYGCNTLGNVWSEADCVFFNKKLMEDNNITTPAEYYAAGKWDLDAMEKCLRDVKNAGYKGGFTRPESLAACYDGDWVKMQDGKMVNNSGSSMLTNVYKRIAKWYEEGLLVTADSYFNDGNVGLCIDPAFGLKRTGTFAKMNQNYVGYTFMPDYDKNTKAQPCGIDRFYGVCKKAPNPVAAGIFLRYYLDSANYDLNKTFISTDAATFFFKVTSAAVEKKNIYYMNGVADVVGTFTWFKYCDMPYKYSSQQIGTAIQAENNVIEGYCKTVNEYIKTQAQ